jgi:nicotinate phosphoribosyltransferase
MDTKRVVRRLFTEHWKLLSSGYAEEAKRFRLDAIRPDTSGNLADKSLRPRSDEDFGVSPELIWKLRELLDSIHEDPFVCSDLSKEAREVLQKWSREIMITATGGFSAAKIAWFHKLGVPSDSYGVGSSLLENSKSTNNDYTADIVQVKLNGIWQPNAKVGRIACDNPNLKPYHP